MANKNVLQNNLGFKKNTQILCKGGKVDVLLKLEFS